VKSCEDGCVYFRKKRLEEEPAETTTTLIQRTEKRGTAVQLKENDKQRHILAPDRSHRAPSFLRAGPILHQSPTNKAMIAVNDDGDEPPVKRNQCIVALESLT
jgi:hypothetical protein